MLGYKVVFGNVFEIDTNHENHILMGLLTCKWILDVEFMLLKVIFAMWYGNQFKIVIKIYID